MPYNSSTNLDLRRIANGFSAAGGNGRTLTLDGGGNLTLQPSGNSAVNFPAFPVIDLVVQQGFSKGALAVGIGADTVDIISAGTDGQILVADSAAVYGVEWKSYDLMQYEVVNASKTAEAGKAYIVDAASAALVELTLPASAGVGATIKVYGMSPNLWSVKQGAGDQIFLLGVSTTLGATGHFDSTTQYDGAEFVHCGAGQWLVVDSSGNFNLV